ncbi:hypothetical protein BKA81DRAFT_107837 [Phyllosticta paracitricarpa]
MLTKHLNSILRLATFSSFTSLAGLLHSYLQTVDAIRSISRNQLDIALSYILFAVDRSQKLGSEFASSSPQHFNGFNAENFRLPCPKIIHAGEMEKFVDCRHGSSADPSLTETGPHDFL